VGLLKQILTSIPGWEEEEADVDARRNDDLLQELGHSQSESEGDDMYTGLHEEETDAREEIVFSSIL
jgi:hypothetical protein